MVEDLKAIRSEIEAILQAADYTGLAPKTHAYVSMDLLWRIRTALEQITKVEGEKPCGASEPKTQPEN
jgi:hypothetical protein